MEYNHGQQLTTYAYKKAMSDIATNVANINAQKVQLNQQQQELDQQWASFQEGIRQYEKTFAEQQRQFGLSYELDKMNAQTQYNSAIYSNLVDMLGRYSTVTQEMASLGAQVGMNLTVGDSTSNYLTEAERLANNQAIYGYTDSNGNRVYGNMDYYNNYMTNQQLQSMANKYLPMVQSSGKIANSSQFAALLAQWKAAGVSADYAKDLISKKDDSVKAIVGTSGDARRAGIDLAYRVLGTKEQYGNYVGDWGGTGWLFAPSQWQQWLLYRQAY